MKNIFVIMPFSKTESCSEDEWTTIYESIFKYSAEECGYSCQRALPSTGVLIESIIEKLNESFVVIADLTDKNPNVLYELGVRHSLSKRTIIVTQEGKHIPSDLKGYWYINYENKLGEERIFCEKLKSILIQIEENPNKIDSPVGLYLERKGRIINEIKQKENIKKLYALRTELTGTILLLNAYKIKSNFENKVVLNDSLNLLLSTYYIDIGQESLRDAYDLYLLLEKIKQGKKFSANSIDSCLTTLNNLILKIDNIQEQLKNGTFKEPDIISKLKWGQRQETSKCDSVSSVFENILKKNIVCYKEHNDSK